MIVRTIYKQTEISHLLREIPTPSSVSHLTHKFHQTANEKNNLSQPTSRDHLTLLSRAFTRPRRVTPTKCFSTDPPFLHFAIGFVAHRLSVTRAPFPGVSPNACTEQHVHNSVLTPLSTLVLETTFFHVSRNFFIILKKLRAKHSSVQRTFCPVMLPNIQGM